MTFQKDELSCNSSTKNQVAGGARQHAKRTPGFIPMCNGRILQQLMNELSIQQPAQVSSDRASLSETADSPNNAKKQVSISEVSTLRLFRPSDNAREMSWSKVDKANFKRDAARMAGRIREALERQNSTASDSVMPNKSHVSPRSCPSSDALPFLQTLEKDYSIEAEELIGLEDLIQGFEHARNADAQRKKINQTVVRAWRRLKQEEIKKCQQGLSPEAAENETIETISAMYKKISRKSFQKARCHAAYVQGMSNGVDSSSLLLGGQIGLNRSRGMCRRAAHAA